MNAERRQPVKVTLLGSTKAKVIAGALSLASMAVLGFLGSTFLDGLTAKFAMMVEPIVSAKINEALAKVPNTYALDKPLIEERLAHYEEHVTKIEARLDKIETENRESHKPIWEAIRELRAK